MSTNINIENISVLIEFDLKEVKSKYVNDGKVVLERVFTILKEKNEDVFYDKKKLTLIYKINGDYVKFFIYRSGKILCVGARKEEEVYDALRYLQKICKIIGVKKISSSIINIIATAILDYQIDLELLACCSEYYGKDYCEITYTPEIFTAAVYKSKLGSANIFANGKIVVITKKKENIAIIVKNIEEITFLTNARIPL